MDGTRQEGATHQEGTEDEALIYIILIFGKGVIGVFVDICNFLHSSKQRSIDQMIHQTFCETGHPTLTFLTTAPASIRLRFIDLVANEERSLTTSTVYLCC